jgi:hypothetical protein
MAQNTEHENVVLFVLSLRPMHRLLATIVLVCFTLVLSAGAVHAHGAVLLQAEQIEQCVDSDAHDACALCDATRDAHVAIVIDHRIVLHTVSDAHEPLIANIISDRCPLQQPGRAPPTTI